MKKALACMSLTTLLVIIALVPAAQAGDADGKALFLEKKCNLCHAIDSQGITKKSEKMKGVFSCKCIYLI